MQIADKIVLGTVQFGLKYGINNNVGKPNEKLVESILNLAFSNGIHILDTAEIYGNAQELIGNYHKSSENRFNIITKFSSSRNDLPQNLTERIKKNLETLGTSSLYAYMFHSFHDFKKYFNTYKAEIKQLKKSTIFRKFGVSVYTNDEIEELLQYEEVDLIQLPFNLLDNTVQRSSVIKKAKAKGIEIHTRSAFLQGLFFMDPKTLPAHLLALGPYLNEINKISEKHDLNVSSLSLNYVVQQPYIDNVLIGVETLHQLQDNLNALQNTISRDAVQQIDSIAVKEIDLLNPSKWQI